ncbi:MAG: hypothetical protein ACTSYA_01260 [Candidatus Kariarchaeaceae archaeon]
MNTKFSKIVIGIAMISLFLLPSHVEGQNKSFSQVSSSSMIILDAYYTDAEGDLKEDDVVGLFQMTFDDVRNTYTAEFKVVLALPSGFEYVYYYNINSDFKSFILEFIFYNHATEAGDYTFTCTLTQKNGGRITSTTSYTFDPPGGDPDDPFVGIRLVS